MSPDDIDKLTIAEVRAIADRAHEALARLREVQSLLGGAAGPPAQVANAVPFSGPAAPPTRTRTPMSDAEIADLRAQREALVQRNRDALPDDIKQMEGIQ